MCLKIVLLWSWSGTRTQDIKPVCRLKQPQNTLSALFAEVYGGLVDGVLPFYSNDASSHPAQVYIFMYKLSRLGTFKNIITGSFYFFSLPNNLKRTYLATLIWEINYKPS